MLRLYKVKYLVGLCFLLTACREQEETFPNNRELTIHDNFFTGKVVFQKLSSTEGFKLLLKNSLNEVQDQAIFKYTPYQLDTGDINHDGSLEILVGLIKTTTFDPVEKKRLFILRIDDEQLRPMWLGSKVCQELINFRTRGHGVIQTIEKSKTNTYSIGHYEWQSFGLTLLHYTHEKISFDEALQIFQN